MNAINFEQLKMLINQIHTDSEICMKLLGEFEHQNIIETENEENTEKEKVDLELQKSTESTESTESIDIISYIIGSISIIFLNLF
eukprot:Pgem_evm1s789